MQSPGETGEQRFLCESVHVVTSASSAWVLQCHIRSERFRLRGRIKHLVASDSTRKTSVGLSVGGSGDDSPNGAALFEAANKLRGSVESAEYKHLVLGLIFLKYVSDSFGLRREQLEAEISDPEGDEYLDDPAEREQVLEDRDEYLAENIFWVPQPARWAALLAAASQDDIGRRIDAALELIVPQVTSPRTEANASRRQPGADPGWPRVGAEGPSLPLVDPRVEGLPPAEEPADPLVAVSGYRTCRLVPQSDLDLLRLG